VAERKFLASAGQQPAKRENEVGWRVSRAERPPAASHRGDQLVSLIARVADLDADRDRLEQLVGSRTQQ